MSRGSHASRLAMSWLAEDVPPRWREVDGSWVLVDLSGFTRLTERLAGSGAEGVEVLHGALSRCFEALLGHSMELGGDVLGFAGDAALLHFAGSDHLVRAAQAASSMSPRLAALPASLTGGRRLRVSIGLHTGVVAALLAGAADQRLLLCGPDVSLLARLQGAASAGQVVMSAAAAAAVGEDRHGELVDPGVVLLPDPAVPARADRVATATPGAGATDDWSPRTLERSLRLLSPVVRESMNADVEAGGAGEHRTVSVGFVMVSGLDGVVAAGGAAAAHPVLSMVIESILRVNRELDVELIDTDVGVDSVKVLVTAGAPRAVADDEERLLLALRRIVDECSAACPPGVSVRAGAQRGRVFAGRLGVPGRSTYTVIGDPVNVAARALGRAGSGELVVGDGLGVERRVSVRAHGLGHVSLRNRVKPVEMWRVESVSRTPVDADRSPVATGRPLSVPVDLVRRDEWAVIADAWERAERGSGGAVMVTGEPGMGVSDLVHEAAHMAGPAATLVEADAFARHVPYGLLARLVRGLATAAGAAADDGGWTWLLQHRVGLPDYLQEWSRASVALARSSGAVSGGDPQTMAARARRALAALLAAAVPRPWMLAVDDLDLADESSRAVLSELCVHTVDAPLLIVAGATTAVLADDAGQVPRTSVELLALDDDVAASLVLHIAPVLRPDQIARTLAAGRGNPLVLAELARHPSAGELPDSLQRLGAVLVDALPVATRALVRDASTFGSVVSLGAAAAVLARPELADPASWSAASSVIRPAAGGELVFVHDAYRTAAYESLTFRRRRELHGAIADYMSAQGAPPAGSLAIHLQLAGRLAEALPLATTAGLAAKQSGALAEAVELLGRADEMANALGDPSLTFLLVELGEVLSWLGNVDAERILRRVVRRAPTGDQRAHVSHLMADHLLRRGEYRRAGRWIRRGVSAVDLMGAEGDRWRGKLLLDESWRQSDFGRQARSIELALGALGIAEQIDDVMLRGLAHLYLEAAYSFSLDDRALECGAAAVRCFEEAGHDRYSGAAYCNVALTLMHLGRWQEALEWYERSRVFFARAGWALDVAHTDLNIGFLLHRQGHQGRAEALAIAALRTFEALGARRWLGFGWVLRGFTADAEGRFAEAEEWSAKARELFVELHDTAMIMDCDVGRIDYLVTVGRVDEVLASAPGLERRLATTDVEHGVRIGFDRVVGHARVLAGDRGGFSQLRRALRHARAKRLPYSEYLCLEVLWALAGELPPREAAQVEEALRAVVAKLGIVTSELLAPPA